jgi:ribosomal protein S18 acetylase RimI-like enzyme
VNSFLSLSVKTFQSDCVSHQGDFPLIIRHAKMEDVNELGNILTKSFHNPVGMTFWLYPLLKLGVCEDLRARFRASTPNYTCLVAVKPANKLTGEEAKIVGTVELSVRTAYYWHLKKKYPYIANLAVSNSYRRKGVATQLIVKCEQISYSWGFKQINLHVLEDNEKAKNLYLRNGYIINHIDSNLYSWLTRSPRRLFLQKSLS